MDPGARCHSDAVLGLILEFPLAQVPSIARSSEPPGAQGMRDPSPERTSYPIAGSDRRESGPTTDRLHFRLPSSLPSDCL